MDASNLDHTAAARLLQGADRAHDRSLAQTDFRAQAIQQLWTAIAMFAYVTTFLLLFGDVNDRASTGGAAYVNVLLIPFLVFVQLIQGARNRLPIVVGPRRRSTPFLLALPAVIVFVGAFMAMISGLAYPWGVKVLMGAAAAAPLGVLALGTARKARATPRPAVTLRAPVPRLSTPATTMTIALGIYFGLVAVCSPYDWFPLASFVFVVALVILLVGWNARWGLPSVGSEWGRRQWMAFGIAFSLLFAVTIIAATTSANSPIVGAVGGVLVAAPLIVSARTAPRDA